MAAAAVDVGYIAASFSVEETTLQSLLSEPTVELVQSLLVQIDAKAREYDDLKSDKLRAEVELEGAVHNANIRARSLQATADEAVKEAEALRQKLTHEETARQHIESQLQSLQTSATGATSQVHTLESRVKTLEAQNRDAVALHDAKSAAHDRLAEELSAQHQKFVALRKQVGELEEKNQSLDTAATSVRFRESNFQQEIELLRKNNEWFESEMKTRAADNTKFRKEKNAQMAELQRANADAIQTIDSLRSKETAQNKRIEELEQRVEQSLSRVQQLQEDARQNQESFRLELDNARRLATLHQESANTVKKRLQEVQDQLTSLGDQAAEEVGRLQAEVESERNKAADYENKVAELETMLENQESQLSEMRNAVTVPATPRRAMNGSFDSPGRAGSPLAFSPGGSRMKGGMSMTQLYTENTKLKQEVRSLQELSDKRGATLEEILEELENKYPEMQRMQEDNVRLTDDLANYSALLNEAIEQKEAAVRDSRKYQGNYEGLVRERDLDRQQIRDATFQSKLLLYRFKQQEEGMDELSAEEQQFLNDAINNEVPAHLLDDDDTSTSRLISKHLVLFKSVGELVDKNQELLRSIREVAQRYEGSEAQAKAAKQEQDHAELLRLRDQISQYEHEIETLKLRSQSYMKERDMYRRIVTSRGQGGTPAFGESVGEGGTPVPAFGDSVMSVSQSKDAELIKELQTRLDTVKEEYATDRTSSKQQIDTLVKENRQLQSDNVRLSTKQEMIQERYDLLQHKIGALEVEKSELKKQYASLNDQLAKTDTQRQHDSETLIEVRSQLDSLERENINLKASQSLWKTIEARLAEDRNMLIEDKSRLNKIINDMQTLRNEHDLTEAQNRRNLQTRADALEAELQNVKRKLEDETEDHKKFSMRHEWEQTEKQRKIDDLVKASNEVRQELASVKSTRDQLQTRVNELQIEVQKAQERIQVSLAQHTPQSNNSGEADEESLSREEQLESQLANLQHKLDRALEDLDAANSRADDLQSIAQSSEDRMLEVEEAAEKLQQEFEEKVADISRLREQVEELSNELTSAKTELSELRSGQSQEIMQLTQQQQSLEADISRLQDEMDIKKAEIEIKTQEVAAQAEIANRAQQDYENEFRKHGETMASLRTTRTERDQFSGEIMQYKTQAEAASASLAQNEEHWAATREQYERELAEARTRYSQQEESNKTLYAQYDALTAQIASLKSEQLSVAAGHTDTGSLDSSLSGLQSLNKILRDDKDVLQLQMNAKELELQRVRQELSHKEEQLDRANEKLIVDQAQINTRQNGANHQALQENIAQLNVYRESNTTLRNEKNRLENERDDMRQKIEALNNDIEPLKARVMDLEGELEVNSAHVKTLEEDRDRWQKRHQDVLLRYDRIDPKDLEDLKNQLEVLQAERDQAVEQVSTVDDRIRVAKEEEKAVQQAEWETRKAHIVNQARNKARSDAEKRREIEAERDQATMERDSITAERDEANSQLDEVQTQLVNTQSELESTRHALEEANARPDVTMEEEGQVDEGNPGFSAAEKTELEARLADAEDRANRFSNESASLGIKFDQLQNRERELESQIAELQQRIGVLNEEVSKAQSEKQQSEAPVENSQSDEASTQPPAVPQSSEEVEDLKERLAAAEKELEDLQTQTQMTESFAGQNDDERVKTLSDQLAEQAEQLASIQALLKDCEEAKADAEEAKVKVEKDFSDFRVKTAEEREKFKNKANEKIKEKGAEVINLKAQATEQAKVIDDLRKEIEGLKQQQGQGSIAPDAPMSDVTKDLDSQLQTRDATIASLKAEIEGLKEQLPTSVSLPAVGATKRDIQDWLNSNEVTQAIMKNTVRKLQAAEQASGPAVPSSPIVKTEQEKAPAESAPNGNTVPKEEHEKILADKESDHKKALAKTEELALGKSKVQLNMAKTKLTMVETRWGVVEKAASETPEKPVKEVYDLAKVAKPTPAAPAAPAATAPANAQPAKQLQPPQPVKQITPSAPSPTPAYNAPQQHQQPNQQGPPNNYPQANGPRPNQFSQSANFGQPAFGQPMNPFTQSNPQPYPNPHQNPFGGYNGSGLPQPSFTNPGNQYNHSNQGSRPNSPFTQQGGGQQQHVGTGPAALRGLGQAAQSGIPRGGSGLPMPARGRGGPPHQQQQQHQVHVQQQLPLGQNPGAGAAVGPPGVGPPGVQGASQIGRGGGRGGGGNRGRGGGGGGPGSPMNPVAMNFTPPNFAPGTGRGQKRGLEDDAGAQRGGKRQRGGRGGQGQGQGQGQGGGEE
ncbi:hypothetical protein P280DRAFT_547682 [Massarina eburnea CBS 473.64]|uniref:Uncharacterized protein n=1 Tax=Massarina eburnea CBS 473.64 TaxID=1395130 RepID=A0A6A6S717_9PLEO|nr:hypothetical protein P280DRAFT_547682 [Massarina eburnea CBS 473.64]